MASAQPTRRFQALLVDLDGVVTRTAVLHARAWKRTFDAFLSERPQTGAKQPPFDEERDYHLYVDGKPRDDGIRSFLAARGLVLPEDTAEGSTSASVRSLGERKNRLFRELLEEEGVQTYADGIEQLERWRRLGLKTALVTSSRNGRAILRAARIEQLFDLVFDWAEAEPLGLRGKPAPDTFLEAARRLGVHPERAVVLEDAVSGVEAGRAGNFGLVVGVARVAGPSLVAHGADIEVRDLRELGDLDTFPVGPDGVMTSGER